MWGPARAREGEREAEICIGHVDKAWKEHVGFCHLSLF